MAVGTRELARLALVSGLLFLPGSIETGWFTLRGSLGIPALGVEMAPYTELGVPCWLRTAPLVIVTEYPFSS